LLAQFLIDCPVQPHNERTSKYKNSQDGFPTISNTVVEGWWKPCYLSKDVVLLQ